MERNEKEIMVIYKTKYGSAKRYAEWIADEVNGDLLDVSQAAIDSLNKYNTIIYIGSMYAVGILGISLIKENFSKLKDKKIIVISVGASPAYPEALEHVKNSNFTDEMKETVHYFHLRGGFNYNKLNVIDKVAMYLLKKKLERIKTDELTTDQKGMLESYKHPTDWTNKMTIAPIIECINNKL